jgi:hypothetical protein
VSVATGRGSRRLRSDGSMKNAQILMNTGRIAV